MMGLIASLFGSTTDLMEELQTKRKKINVIRNTHWRHPNKCHTGLDRVPVRHPDVLDSLKVLSKLCMGYCFCEIAPQVCLWHESSSQ